MHPVGIVVVSGLPNTVHNSILQGGETASHLTLSVVSDRFTEGPLLVSYNLWYNYLRLGEICHDKT